MWIDIHAHLYDFTGAQLAQHMREAGEGGVCAVVNAATSLATAHTVIAQCATNPMLYAACGISAFDCVRLDGGWAQALEAVLSQPRVVALGEIGLDAANPAYPALDKQTPVFEKQLELSCRAHLPAVIHSRGCEIRACDMCRAAHVPKALFHCFTGGIDALRAILDAGYHVSFSGIITFPKSSLADCIGYVPLDRLFVETDTPYLAPVPYRGRPNRPAWVVEVGKAVAAIKKMPAADVARRIARNAQELFGIGCAAPCDT